MEMANTPTATTTTTTRSMMPSRATNRARTSTSTSRRRRRRTPVFFLLFLVLLALLMLILGILQAPHNNASSSSGSNTRLREGLVEALTTIQVPPKYPQRITRQQKYTSFFPRTTTTVATAIAGTSSTSITGARFQDKATNPPNPQPPSPRRSSRRVRYDGKYPRNFAQKYKEHRGDATVITKVLSKGMTPAGTHVPIMLKECFDHLGLLPFTVTTPAAAITAETTTTNDDDSRPLAAAAPALLPVPLIVDCTLGYGGHASYVLKALQNVKRSSAVVDAGAVLPELLAFDQDSIEIRKTEIRLRQSLLAATQHHTPVDAATAAVASDNDHNTTIATAPPAETVRLTVVNQNFRTVKAYLEQTGQVGMVTALFADLGLSSMQIDDNTRGFTYKRDGPLDMRMATTAASSTHNHQNKTNEPTTTKETAYDLLCRLTPKHFEKILKENSDELYANEIAFGLLQHTTKNKQKKKKNRRIPETTTELANRVREIVEPIMVLDTRNEDKKNNSKQKKKKKGHQHTTKQVLDRTVARVMQALRIELNQEFPVLEQLLHDLPDIVAPGGRIVVLTFHSGEDRRVKKAFKAGMKAGIYSSWSRTVVRPTALEQHNNPRSSCCKLRWAIRSTTNSTTE